MRGKIVSLLIYDSVRNFWRNRKISKEMDSPSAMMDVDLSTDRHLHTFRPPSMIDSESSSSTLSNSDIFFEKSTEEQYKKDILERLFYRTTQDESKTTVTFISHVFFSMFLSKMKS